MVDDLWNVGMVAGYKEKMECARYFEENGSPEKAAILYHRAGTLKSVAIVLEDKVNCTKLRLLILIQICHRFFVRFSKHLFFKVYCIER